MKTYSFLLVLFFSGSVLAHPHAFIDMQTTPIIENNQLIGLSMKWTLDEPSSSAVIYDMKQAKTKNDQQKLIDDVMGNIVSEHYFSYLYDAQNNKIKYSPHPKNYGVKIQGLQLQYYFDVPLAHSQNLEKNTFSLQTYDPTYYVAMAYASKSTVDFSALPKNCQGKLIEPNVDEKIQAYASSLDKSQKNEDDSLGVMFAQKIIIQCE
ncbi:zinc transporter binding subunit ZevA [Haemophilus sp. oral taxon 851]|uniref:zinc transporter binding subunit ZevA n=1 Tax=Haemophilus sp. oral taxon 851 TaxID=762964 RepID=UPI0002462A94|nr:zinc transporter binding subunit ZevA [Haemophilus sp. oral taxon 851]EHO48678.1 hypothetical protein HMPREF9096_00399 [Haemophilus sp. oral taxon 851 str. F0397]